MKAALIFVLIALPAVARLGDTEAQVLIRYGQPQTRRTNDMGLQMVFQHSNLCVVVMFMDGHSVREFVTNTPQNKEIPNRMELRNTLSGVTKWVEDPDRRGSYYSVAGFCRMLLSRVDVFSPVFNKGNVAAQKRREKIMREAF
jgi:hypothetical protein